LFVAVPEPWRPESWLHCLDGRRGHLRFRHGSGKPGYGSRDYPPPSVVTAVLPAVDPAGKPELWVSTVGNYFPSVISRLDASGRELAAYWNAGHISALLRGRLWGRQVLIAGGASNEHGMAVLVVLDASRPSGSLPTTDEKYRCLACPPGESLAVVLFPRSRLTDEAGDGGFPSVEQVFQGADGRLAVVVRCPGPAIPAGTHPTWSEAHWTFTANLEPVGAEFGDSYVPLMRRAKEAGLVRSDPEPDSVLFPFN